MRCCAFGKAWSIPKRPHCFASCRRSSAAELELQQVDAEQVRIREQREQDLALKLPAAHLMEIAERELELKSGG